ncbi:CoA transferase subunit A [Bacillus kwashiorkori]|uniref:CoA transferase subunit A n=1 Tax=Bacillus kwashiorkori TaxID=1522318 RepID=UPI00078330D6|nr:CoA transferase subunit A [Bacillus kwashiorkori]
MDNPLEKITSLEKVAHFFHDKMTLLFGGFGGIGTPPSLIDLIIDLNIKDITVIGNDTGFPHIGIGKLISLGRVKKAIVSHIGSNPLAGKQMTNGELEIEFSPQGTLVERIRAGGIGIAGIITDIGIDNEVTTKGKQIIHLNNEPFLLETALTAEVGIVYAKKADPYGNLVFDKSARNTNPLVAMAGEITIAEVEEIVPLGELHPEEIVTPGVFVDYIVPSKGVNWRWVWE